MLKSISLNFVEKSSKMAKNLFGSKYGWVKLAFFSVFVSFFFAFPSYDLIFSGESEWNWETVIKHTNSPFSKQDYPLTSHQSKTELRLTPLIIGYVLRLDRNGYLILQIILLATFFLALAKTLLDIGLDIASNTFISFGFATIFVGTVLTSDIRGIFDGCAFTFLMLSCCFRSPLVIFLSVFFASFTDERGFLAGSIVFLFWILKETDLSEIKITNLIKGNKYSWSVVIAGIAYLVGRLILFLKFGLSTPYGDGGVKLAIKQFNSWAFGVWSGLEGLWLLVISTTIILWVLKRYSLLLAFLTFLGGIIFVAICVIDITRGMAYIFPIIIVSILVLKQIEEKYFNYLCFIAMIVSFFPTYLVTGDNQIMMSYPLIVQLIRLIKTFFVS